MKSRHGKKTFHFSKFGVWDEEVKTFIQQVADSAHISARDLRKWIYLQGVLLFQKTKADLTKADHFKDGAGKTNLTTEYMILGETIIAFSTLMGESLKTVIQDQKLVQQILQNAGKTLIENISANHRKFYQTQAEVASVINNFMDENPNTSRDAIYQHTVRLFNEAAGYDPALETEIQAHLLLMKEFVEYMASKPAPAPGMTLFKPEGTAEQTTSATSTPKP